MDLAVDCLGARMELRRGLTELAELRRQVSTIEGLHTQREEELTALSREREQLRTRVAGLESYGTVTQALRAERDQRARYVEQQRQEAQRVIFNERLRSLAARVEFEEWQMELKGTVEMRRQAEVALTEEMGTLKTEVVGLTEAARRSGAPCDIKVGTAETTLGQLMCGVTELVERTMFQIGEAAEEMPSVSVTEAEAA